MMKKMTMFAAMIGLAVSLQGASAEEFYKYSAGIKVWVAEASYGEGTLFGPTFTMDFNNHTFLVAKGVLGTFEYDRGGTGDAREVEVIWGKSWQWLDAGIGLTYILGEYEVSSRWGEYSFEWEGYGPLLYLATGNVFADGPFGWYFGGTLIPVLFGDMEGADAYFTAEGGLSFSKGRWSGTVGYRSRDTLENAGDLTMQGITGSLAFRF